MAKRRDFQSDIEQLNQRREHLRSHIPLPPSIVIEQPEDKTVRSTDSTVVKRRSTPKDSHSSDIANSPDAKYTQSNSLLPKLPTPINSSSPARHTSEKPSPKVLSPSRVHSVEYTNQNHDELSDIIAQLKVNRLNRRNVNDDDGCQQTIATLLENEHIFLHSSQISTIVPAHIEILVEVLIRAHSDGLTALLRKTCRLIQDILSASQLSPQALSGISEPLSSLQNINGLIILSLESDMCDECMNIVESMSRGRNTKVPLQRFCGAVYSRVSECDSPLPQSVSSRILTTICELTLMLQRRYSKSTRSSISPASAASPNRTSLDEIICTSIISAIYVLVNKTQPVRPPGLFGCWSSFRVGQLLELLSNCFQTCSSSKITIFRIISSLLSLHPSFVIHLVQFPVAAQPVNAQPRVDFKSVAIANLLRFAEEIRTQPVHDLDLNIFFASIRFVLSLSRADNHKSALDFIQRNLTLSHLQDIVGCFCTQLSNNTSNASAVRTDLVEEGLLSNSSGNPVKFEIMLSVCLESVVELILTLFASHCAVICPLGCCFASEGVETGLAGFCGTCAETRALINIADKISQTVHICLLQAFGSESESMIVDTLCRTLKRLSYHFELSQTKPIVSQLCRIAFRHQNKFNLNLCSVIDALSVYSGYRLPHVDDCVYSEETNSELALFNATENIHHFDCLERIVHSQLSSLPSAGGRSQQSIDSFLSDWKELLLKVDETVKRNEGQRRLEIFAVTRKATEGQSNAKAVSWESDTSESSDVSNDGNVKIRVVSKSQVIAGRIDPLAPKKRSKYVDIFFSSLSTINTAIPPFKSHHHTSLLVYRESLNSFLDRWIDMPTAEVFQRVAFMHALCKTSGVGSLLFIFSDISALVAVLCSLLTGDSFRKSTRIVATEVVEAVDEQTEARSLQEIKSTNVTKLVQHKHSAFLRTNRGLTLATISLLSDILLRVPSALPDYKALVTFICVNLDAAISGNQQLSLSLAGRDVITQGIAQYLPLSIGVDRVDDGFILSCIEYLTIILRAHRLLTNSLSGENKSIHRNMPSSFLDLYRTKPTTTTSSSTQQKAFNSEVAKQSQQTTLLREIVSSKLIALGDTLLLMGKSSALRPILRLMVELSPMLGNVVTNTASGSISLLSEPRTIVLTKFLVLGIRCHNAGDWKSVQAQAAALNTSLLACNVLNTIAYYNPKAFYDAISRQEIEDALLELLQSLAAQLPPQFASNEFLDHKHLNEGPLIRCIRIVMKSIRCCIRLHNSTPHSCSDTMWAYPIESLIHNQQRAKAIGIRNRLLRPTNSGSKSIQSWPIIDIADAVITRFAHPVISSWSSIRQNQIFEYSAALASNLSLLTAFIEACANSCLLLRDVIDAARLESAIASIRGNSDYKYISSNSTGSMLNYRTLSDIKLLPNLIQMPYAILTKYGKLLTSLLHFSLSIDYKASIPPVSSSSSSSAAADGESAVDGDHAAEHEHQQVTTASVPTAITTAALLSPQLALIDTLLDDCYEQVTACFADLFPTQSHSPGLLVALLKASYICSDSPSLHRIGLSILTKMCLNGTNLFPIRQSSAAAVGGKKGKISAAKINEEVLLNHNSLSIKPIKKTSLKATTTGSGSAAKEKQASSDAIGRITQCAHFVLASATLCEHVPTFYRQFGVLLKQMASSCEEGREVIVSSGLHKMLYPVLRGQLCSLRDIAQVAATSSSQQYNINTEVYTLMTLENLIAGSIDLLKCITHLCVLDERAEMLYNNLLLEPVAEYLIFTQSFVQEFVAEGSDTEFDGRVRLFQRSKYFVVYMCCLHVAAVDAVLSFAECTNIRTIVLSSPVAATLENSVELILSIANILKPVDVLSVLLPNQTLIELGAYMMTSFNRFDKQIDKLLNQSTSLSDCVIA